MKTINLQSKDYISWDEFFMGIAKLAAKRSKDPSTKVGCCIVDKENRILSIGYNGTPNGFPDNKFPWNREGKNRYDTKYAYVCHSELNAILNYRGSRKDLVSSRLYVTLFPCSECAKAIVQSGIKEVIYDDDKYDGTDDDKAAKLIFDTCKVKYTKQK